MIKIRTLFFIFLGIIAFAPIKAQDDGGDEDPDNLVPNGSFEKYEGSLRRDGQFDLTTDWASGTDEIPTLFATSIKSRYVAIPENMYGKEDPADGENYAGIVAYSYRGKRARSYISVQLKQKLKENTLYCVRFKASLAERSRYASNNLGVVVSKKNINQKGVGILTDATAIVSDQDKIVNQTEGWWQFCKRFEAKGSEQYLTIGNFASDGSTANETREVEPTSPEDKGPEIAAYYYIDDVEIREVASDGDCGCSNTKIPESKIIYSATVQLNDDMTITQKVDAIDAYFYQYQSEVVSSAKRSIDQIIAMMKANPIMKVQVIGHMDNEEAELAKTESSLQNLSEERAKNVREYMASQGVDRTHILMDNKKNTQPASTMTTPISLAKNRRVEFRIVL